MFEKNTVEVIELHPEEVFYGIFGSFHTSMDGFVGNESVLANYLNNEYTETLGGIAAVTFLYYNSKFRNSEGVYNVGEYNLITEAAPFLSNDISLCPIDLPSSPFDVDDDYLSKSQEYLVIISDSLETSIYD